MVIFKEFHNKNKNGTGSYNFSQDNYKAGLCGSGHNLNKDIQQGNATYDAARKNMGVPWMMFTKEQIEELINNTTSLWVTIGNKNGRIFISKNDKSKYILFPATGWLDNMSSSFVGSVGYSWSTKYQNSSGCWCMKFGSNNISWSDDFPRTYGLPIRPVAPARSW